MCEECGRECRVAGDFDCSRAMVAVIRDAIELARVQREWAGVTSLRQGVKTQLFASAGFNGHFSHFLADCANNLPFLHACSMLNEALLQMRDEGLFKCKAKTLGELVKAAEHNLRWADYAAVKEIVKKRNELAHDGVLHPRKDCWRYIDAIEAELRGWSVIP